MKLRGDSISSNGKPKLEESADQDKDINPAVSGDCPQDECQCVLETPQEYKSRRRSHLVISATTLVMSIAFSICQNGVWPYLKRIIPGVDKKDLGWVVTANPLGQIITAPIIGLWATKTGSIRIPAITCILCSIVGNSLYATLYLFKGAGYYTMMAARFIAGASLSLHPLWLSYIGGSTLLHERNTKFTINYAMQSVGYVIGPGLSALLAAVVPDPLESGNDGVIFWDQYTSAGWLAAIFSLLNLIIFMPGIFQEHKIAEKEYQMSYKGSTNEKAPQLPKPNYIGVFSVVFAYFMLVFIPSIRETLATPITADQYGISDTDAVFAASLVISGVGLVAIFIMIIITRIGKNVDHRKALILFGFAPLAVSMALHYPMGNKPIVIANCSSYDQNILDTQNSTVGITLSKLESQFPYLSKWDSSHYMYPAFSSRQIPNVTNSSEPCYGCPYESQSWCLHTPQITPVQLISSYLLTRTTFSVCMTFSQSLYSKILGPSPQGVWMSLLSVGASSARIIGPIWIAYLYEGFGTTYTYVTMFIIELLATISLVMCYKHLAPMNISGKNVESENRTEQLTDKV